MRQSRHHLTALQRRRASSSNLNFIAAELEVCIWVINNACPLRENRDTEIPRTESEERPDKKHRLPANREVGLYWNSNILRWIQGFWVERLNFDGCLHGGDVIQPIHRQVQGWDARFLKRKKEAEGRNRKMEWNKEGWRANWKKIKRKRT